MSEAARMKKCAHYKKMMEQKGKCSMNEKENCENKTLCLQFDQDREVQNFDFDLNKQFKSFIWAYSSVFFLNDFSFENNLPFFAHYKPPLISRDIPVLFQSFLI